MKRLFSYFMIFATLSFFASCEIGGEEINDITIGGESSVNVSSAISPACVMDNRGVSRAQELGFVVRSLIDQITTKQMNANFLRLDEDLDDSNNGLYTFTRGTNRPVNWNKAYLLESTIISSPDNTEGIHYRSVSLRPEQTYKLNIEEKTVDGEKVQDTTHFYHTRMVGWYPMNCILRATEGVAATEQFEHSDFDAVRLNETITINGEQKEVVALHFTGLDGETDLMVSDVREAQSWHKYGYYKTVGNTHPSDIHPTDNSNIYREPFGHNFENPYYSNYFTYRHYRSAIRVLAHADDSENNLVMWGEIQKVIVCNQPTSCKVWLPTEIGQFGDVYEWNDYGAHEIVKTPMFDNDTNHPEYNETAKYPISLSGPSTKDDIYLGYSLVQPRHNVDLEVHTSSGVYTVTIESHYKTKDANGNDTYVDFFDPGFIYQIRLNFRTDGTIAAILEKEGEESYYDLSRLLKFEVSDGNNPQTDVYTYKLANCYVVSPNEKDGSNNVLKETYDGYCFLASVVGNGGSGIISNGAQTLYPTNENIKPVKAYLLWESQLGLLSDVELKYGYVRFKLPNPDARGNAVIAVYDSKDKVLWSWHIWITDKPAEQTLETGGSQIVFLDRNLGATAATCNSASNALATYGLYYQWGRKDPSMGPPTYNYSPIDLNTAPYYDFSSDEKTAAEVVQFAEPTLQNGVENPKYLILPTTWPKNYIFNWTFELFNFLWGYNATSGSTTKTIYDPCPYGYRVPSSELSALFATGNGSAGTYGYTRTVNGVQFFFPYTGFKGVDMGLNSNVCSWKYVGQKGDYQSSMYCNDADQYFGTGNAKVSQYLHRSRIYISKSNSWTETNVGTYNGNVHNDYANRRTAAPVRCVKDMSIGSITATLDSSVDRLWAGESTTLSYTASSYGGVVESVKITATYTTTSGTQVTKVLLEQSGIGKYSCEGSVRYIYPSDCNRNGVRFDLIVRNEFGLSAADQCIVKEPTIDVTFNRWEVTNNTSVTNSRGYVLVDEAINYYVTISADSEPTNGSVKINGTIATKANEPASGTGVSNTVWCITNYKPWAEKGYYGMSVVVTVNGKDYTSNVGSVTVYGGLKVSDTPATSLKTDGTMYVMQNTNYTSTYVTTSGNNVAATPTSWVNEYCFVTLEKSGSSYNIKSVEKDQYFKGTSNNSSVSLGNSGTSYTISKQEDGDYYIISYISPYSGTTRYLIQDATTVRISTNSSGRNWYFYEVTYDMPE